MEAFKIENLTFKYPMSARYAISDVSFTVNYGEFVTVCGKSGSGKSTLLRQLVPTAAPHGERSGNVYFMGRDAYTMDLREQCESIGFVTQNPDNQLVTDKVWHELAFGPESLGMETPEIRARVSEMAAFFGIQTWFHKNVSELSGGQKQLLNLASVMVMQPKVLILDEPTSQLDPIGAQDFLNILKKLNNELGLTVIMTEHRLEGAFELSDRVIALSSGRIIADGTPSEVGKMLCGTDMFDAMPSPMRVYALMGGYGEYPVTVREGREFLAETAKTREIKPIEKTADFLCDGVSAVEIRDVYFRYEKKLDDVLAGLSLKAYEGEIYAIVGGNGAGKTTTLNVISGISKPYRGRVITNGKKIGVMPQDPKLMFVKKTVFADLCYTLNDEAAVNEVAEICGLSDVLERHPYDLSGGEQQKLALAKLLLLKPQILLLDEPTKGMDAHFKTEFARLLTGLKKSGTAIIMVSHDVEFCAEYADRCAFVFDGKVTSQGTAREFFSEKCFYTTAANRMSRGIIDGAVTAEDILTAFGKEVKKKEFKEVKLNLPIEEKPPKLPKVTRSEKKGFSIITALLVMAVIVPLTIFIGMHFFEDRKYYFISLLIILEAMIPPFIALEKRKVHARELVLISVLCAIAVVSRGAFYMLPQIKPMAAVVIIAGVSLGGETGFLIGVISAFVSNMFFGQGPWTPWQMFAFGSLGFFAGVIFHRLPRTRVAMCVYGFLAVTALYGGIMNISSVALYQSELTLSALIASEVMGLPFDLIHAAVTVLFLCFAAPPMLEMLERVKTKYGIGK